MIPARRRTSAIALLLLLGTAAGPLAAGVKVQVEGLGSVERDNVLARLSIRARGERDDLEESEVRRLHAQAERDIADALQPYGYYSPVVKATLEGAAPDWTARYVVDAGQETRVHGIDARYDGAGADFEPLQDRLRKLPLKVDERLKHEDYEATKKRMSDAAYANGFLDANWATAQLRVDPALHQADAVLHLDTGPRYFFGPVTLEQSQFDPEFIERYIGIPEGAAFDPQKILDLQFRLSDLGYFQSVEIEPERELTDEQQRIPILVRATPRPRTKYAFGVGYGTDTGARLSTGIDWRWLNRSGHVLETDLRLSEIKNTLATTYRVPLGATPGESLSFSATAETEKLDAGDTLKYVIGTSLNRSPGKWQRRVYLEYTHEESRFGDAFTTADLMTPGVSFTRSVADDPIYTRRGVYLFGDVHGAVNNLLSNTSFFQTRLLLRGIYPLAKRVRLIGRSEFGYSIVQTFGSLPASQRFFAGGDQSVRGYSYQSLGPKDSDGKVIGGRYLNVYSVEAEYRLLANWGLAMFLDAGGADDRPAPALSKGVGAGLRYRVPIGSLQFDLAHPMDDDQSGVRVHIGVRVGV